MKLRLGGGRASGAVHLARGRALAAALACAMAAPGATAFAAGVAVATDALVDAIAMPGWHERSLRRGGAERWYRVYVPDALARGAPAVLLLHGGTQSMRKLFRPGSGGSRHWLDIAEREHLLLVVPNGLDPRTGDAAGDRQQWNDLRADGDAPFAGADDVGFIVALLDRVEAEFGFDARRLYVTGASNGGMMSFRLLIEVPQRFAAGAAFIAALPPEPIARPAVPTPLMIMNGTDDPLVPWAGGQVARNRGEVRSTPATVQWWVGANRLPAEATATGSLPDVDPTDGCRIEWQRHGGEGAAPVLFYAMRGGGHAMPSQRHRTPRGPVLARLLGTQCRDVEGAELAWQFLSRFSR